jgi:hypothetical protein
MGLGVSERNCLAGLELLLISRFLKGGLFVAMELWLFLSGVVGCIQMQIGMCNGLELRCAIETIKMARSLLTCFMIYL